MVFCEVPCIYFDFLNLLTRGDVKHSNIWAQNISRQILKSTSRPKSTGNPINNQALEKSAQISGFSK